MADIRWYTDVGSEHLEEVGGKNASLGEMTRTLIEQGVRVPRGFALTASAYRDFIEYNQFAPEIRAHLEDIDSGFRTLADVGASIRKLILSGAFPNRIQQSLNEAYAALSANYEPDHLDVAVRSSATAEDLPEASFAGQQETFLNVRGPDAVLEACRKCYASLFTDRAIVYRARQGFDHLEVALSVGIQRMVRSDLGSAGVCFSIDTETGFPDVVIISAAWGLGETVVQGTVTPDQYSVFKPLLNEPGVSPIVDRTLGSKERKMIYRNRDEECDQPVCEVDTSEAERNSYVLSDEDVLELARYVVTIEDHYQRPMDIEWAKDGKTGELFIVQARPETVQSRSDTSVLKTYDLVGTSDRLVTGISVGQSIATGRVCVIKDPSEIDRFVDGAILVTEMTDPDWVPVMERASGIVTNSGGRTCHAAIVSRELGTPAVVGCGDATELLEAGQEVTLSCAEGEVGYIYDGFLEFEETEVDLDVPETKTDMMLNIGSPAAAFRWWRLPSKGVGLARMEFIISNHIQIHPMALVKYDELEDEGVKATIAELTRGYEDKTRYFVDHLARGVAKIAAASYPHPVIVRMSDFKTNEYADLIGGAKFETPENNPMLGFRGASRYYSDRYREGFALECEAIRCVREEIGLKNVLIMIPFCRTIEEADRVLATLADNGLVRGEDGLEVYVMAEVPSNIILADQFAERFDGFSIGSNDLTQLILGVDRDSAALAELFDERNEAVKRAITDLIERAHAKGCKVGICGQAPSDHADFAEFLVEAGIDSMSLNPDSLVGVKRRIAAMEAQAVLDETPVRPATDAARHRRPRVAPRSQEIEHVVTG